MKRKLFNKAFTLIELLVVIAIISILSALIIVGTSSATDKASIAKGQAFSNSLRNSVLGNLLAEWKLNEGSGTAITNSWSNTYTGTLACAGASCWKTGSDCMEGSCLYFNASDGGDVVTITSNSDFNATSQTIEAWIYPNTWTAATSTVFQRSYSSSDQDWYWIFYGGGGGATSNVIYSLIYFTNTSAVDTGYVYPRFGPVQMNKWYHAAIVLTSDGKANMYINGVSQTASLSTAANFLHWGRAGALNSTVNIQLGGWGSLYSTVDGIRFYNTAASLSQVRQNYFSGINKLLAKQGIKSSEYQQRLAELTSNYAEK
jgi:prepilin-type N-terminal cleavage/methylation domain-containing protein